MLCFTGRELVKFFTESTLNKQRRTPVLEEMFVVTNIWGDISV